jgi:hypothetical protein
MKSLEIAWIFTALTIIGTLSAVHKKWWCFLIFAATNTYWIFYDIKYGALAQATVFLAYVFINMYGAWKWLRNV